MMKTTLRRGICLCLLLAGNIQNALATVIVSASAVTAVEGTSFQGTAAIFATADVNHDPGNYTATVFWGDGAISLGVIQAPTGTGIDFDVTAGHTYAEAGTYTVLVTILDFNDQSSASSSNVATVSDAPLQAKGLDFTSTPGQVYSGTVATFSDANPDGQISAYSATVDWGDGTVTPGNVQVEGSAFGVSGAHTYSAAAARTVTTTIDDIGGSSAIAKSFTGGRIFADGFQ